MKVQTTLTSDEYEALSKAPGGSAPLRLKWLVRFWQAVLQKRAAEAAEAVPVPAPLSVQVAAVEAETARVEERLGG